MEKIVVKNTFLDAPPLKMTASDSPLARAASDPTGAHAKNTQPFFGGPEEGAILEEDEDDDDGYIGDGLVRGAPLALKSDFDGATEPATIKTPVLPQTDLTWCVRNTFIDTSEQDKDEGEILFRSQSDTTGANRRYSRHEPVKVNPILEAPEVEKEGIIQVLESKIDKDDEEEDDDTPLVRAGEGREPPPSLETLLKQELLSQDDQLKRLLSGGVDNHDALVGSYPFGMPPMPMTGYEYPGMYMMPPMYPMAPPMYPMAMPQMTPGSAPLPEPGTAPPFGFRHQFHRETCNTGAVTPCMRGFTKVHYEGLLSTITEAEVHDTGVQRYLVQFSSGTLSPADGVGFVFNSRLPCPKNIQKIVSIFANAHGRINIRVYDQIVKCQASIKALELGEWIELLVDLDNKNATFYIWPATFDYSSPSGEPLSKAEVPYGTKLSRRRKDDGKAVDLRCGHLAVVVKNTSVSVAIGS